MQSTRHPQDDLLIVEALTQLGDDLDGTNAVRAARARRLARDIAAEHGLDVADALFQIDAGPVADYSGRVEDVSTASIHE